MYTMQMNQSWRDRSGVPLRLRLLALATLLSLLLIPSAAAASLARTPRPQYANTHVFGETAFVGQRAPGQPGPASALARFS